MTKYERGQQIETFLRDGEPFFLLRAQDVLALGTLAYYSVMAEASGAPNAQAMRAVLVEFAEYQLQNPEMVKLPD